MGRIIQNPLTDFVQRKFEPRPESTAKQKNSSCFTNQPVTQ